MGQRSNADSHEEQCDACPLGQPTWLGFVFVVRRSRATWIASCSFHARQPAATSTGLPQRPLADLRKEHLVGEQILERRTRPSGRIENSYIRPDLMMAGWPFDVRKPM